MNSEEICYNPKFTHIYVENRVYDHPRTQEILAHFPRAEIIRIEHYKDVFNRRRQDVVTQHLSQNLILAAKKENYFYEGAPVCQSFGNENFYYCSTMMNCVFDCSYCYLKGMYPSGNLVIFVNLEDYFEALDEILKDKSMYLCISYDADLLAMESVTGYAELWAEFAGKHRNLKLEIRTKSARTAMWEELPCLSNVIYAFTLAPQQMITACERKTPSAGARIECALSGLSKGFPVRLCFDPMIYQKNWREDYGELVRDLDQAFAAHGLSMNQLTDASVGTFRISQDYIKKIRKMEPVSPVAQFPYVNVGGVYQYPKELIEQMESYLIGELEKRMDREKIFHE